MIDNPYLAPRLRPFAHSIFAETAQQVATHKAINLGQGMPDTDGPAEMIEAATAALRSGHNQYGPARGTAELREAVARYRRDLYGQTVDPDSDVVITSGATEAIFASIFGLLNPGDEVLIFDPWYELYPAAARMAGAVPVPIALDENWRPSPQRLEDAITPRSRMLILNTPHNPTGTVLSREELEALGEVVERYDLLVVSDEVYEKHIFTRRHVPVATTRGFQGRTITVSAVSKLFNATGWKLGWAIGPQQLIAAVTAAKQWSSFCPVTPLQYAVATALTSCRQWWDERARVLEKSRADLTRGLNDLGMEVSGGEGSFFLTTDISTVSNLSGRQWCAALPEIAGVAAIPLAALCSSDDRAPTSVRWSFCVQPTTIEAAMARLAAVDLSLTGHHR